jgi:hypothetical protein
MGLTFFLNFSFLSDLRSQCTAKVGNEEFWSQVKEVGRPLSLISENEARKYGGTSEISENKSEEVCCILFSRCYALLIL